MTTFQFPYNADPAFQKPVAYFCMEYGIHQSLKTYAGGLGFLAGSYMRSAYDLKQNIVGVGILWKFGYYDQVRRADRRMDVLFEEKIYGFLEKTDIRFTIQVSGHPVVVTAFYLPPAIFKTAPVFFLSTDLPENDYLARTICHKLYDSNPETKIAASILLGYGGAMLLEKLNWWPEIYHLNESHALPLAFRLYERHKNLDAVKRILRFTNHTPEPGGNPKNPVSLLERMSFFGNIPLAEIQNLAAQNDGTLDHTLTALRFSGIANSVSTLHLHTLKKNWPEAEKACPIISVTNAQHFSFWANKEMYHALAQDDDESLARIKKNCKKILFEEIADQNGEIYDDNILTIVFAKRFGGYKRAGLLLQDMERFHRLVTNTNQPVQIIWAGKPYPSDYDAISLFDRIVDISQQFPNCSTMVGYELKLSKLLKQGADVWLNVPRLSHEASGTSGMSAAMNGAVNLSTMDGWFPEFAQPGINSFAIPRAAQGLTEHDEDVADANNLYNILEQQIIPLYYNNPDRWMSVIKNSMKDIFPQFDSGRMAVEYYNRLYCEALPIQQVTSQPDQGHQAD